MKSIDEIEASLLGGKISIKEAQRQVSVLLNSRDSVARSWTNENERERAVVRVDNAFEKIIYTLNPNDQVAAAVPVFQKVRRIMAIDSQAASNS